MRIKDFLAGLFLGGLAGTITMLLIAPKSGKRTRSQLQHQFMDLRDQVGETVDEAEEEALRRAHKVASDMRHKVDDIQHHGKVMFDRK